MSSPDATPTETTPLLPTELVAVSVDDPGQDAKSDVSDSDDGSDSSVQIDWVRLFRFIWPYILPGTWPLRLHCALSVFSIVLMKFVYLVPPFAIKMAVDTLVENAARSPDSRVTPLFAIALGFSALIVGSMLGTLRSVTYAMVSTKNRQRFSVYVFRPPFGRILTMPLHLFPYGLYCT